MFKHSCIKHLFPKIPDYKASIRVGDHGYIWYSHSNGYVMFSGRIVNTKDWCKLCGMSKINTMGWLLKYGTKLPTHISQLEQDLVNDIGDTQ